MHPEYNWGYSNDSHGPSEWPKYYQAGELQSPINILIDLCDLHLSTCCGCALSEQWQSDLNISKKNRDRDKILHTNHRRAHLDSIGNDEDDAHQRSPSTSSTGSGQTAGHSSPDIDQYRANERHKVINCAKMRRHAGQVQTQNTRYCRTNKKIFLGYPRYLSSMQLCNTGHAWQINLPPELAHHTLLSGPPFGDREYRLAQLHCHWGEDCDHGSEHLINGQSFSAEIHFVHWNCTDFQSAEEASRHKHGLAVLAVLVQALPGDRNRNKHLDKIIAGLPRVYQPNCSTRLTEARLDLKKLFPANRWNYATYEGSLTTPPLSEVVDWVVFLQPIQCSTRQIEQFRQIRCPTGSITRNCRPVQPLNNRVVSVWTHLHPAGARQD